MSRFWQLAAFVVVLVLGTLFLATVIARLVGAYTSQPHDRRPAAREVGAGARGA